MKISLYLFLLFTLSLWSCTRGKKAEGKHLFILSGQSNMVRLDHKAYLNPWLEREFGPDNYIVVKQAKGAQPISRWYRDWIAPDLETSAGTRGDLYDILWQRIQDSIGSKSISSVTFIWMQGERDARLGLGEVYAESLLGLYQQLSDDLNRPDMNFVIGRLSDFDLDNEKYPHWTLLRQAQQRVGESRKNFAWVNTDDLNDGLNARGKDIHNDLHMSQKGYERLGKRMAEEAIMLIRGK